jgi:hypothetical protein
MTQEELLVRAQSNLSVSDQKEIGPVALWILEQVMTYLVTKCIERLTHKDITHPGLLLKARLHAKIFELSHYEYPTIKYKAARDEVFNAILKTGPTITENEYLQLAGKSNA